MTMARFTEGRSQEQLYRIVILVLVGALVVTGCVVIWLVSEKNKANDEVADQGAEIEAYAAGPEARDAAEEMLLEMTSYDYRDIDDEFAWLDNFDEELRARFSRRVVPNLEKLIRKGKLSARGEVVQSAYNTIDAETATVLAFVRQELSAKGRKQAVEEQWTTLTMVRDDDEWLIDDIDIVTVPPPS